MDKWVNPEDGEEFHCEFTPVWRWRRAMLNNCQTRFDWCVKSYEEANHHPVAILNGDTSRKVLEVPSSAGASIELSAEGSSDPDGDDLSYSWSYYKDPGTYGGSVEIKNGDSPTSTVLVPSDAAGTTIHVILEIYDTGAPNLYAYRRAILKVK